jgi:hypothetical protein
LFVKNATTDGWPDLIAGFERAWNAFEADAKATLLYLTARIISHR